MLFSCKLVIEVSTHRYLLVMGLTVNLSMLREINADNITINVSNVKSAPSDRGAFVEGGMICGN